MVSDSNRNEKKTETKLEFVIILKIQIFATSKISQMKTHGPN